MSSCAKSIVATGSCKMARSGTWTKHSMCDGAKGSSSGCACVLARAKDVQKKLSPRSATCVKLVNPSQRTYLALPRAFSFKNLPNFDQTVVFVGENGKRFRVGYCCDRVRFSVGWKRFFNAHSLLEGDALVFHLIDSAELCKLKVHVVRSCRPKNVKAAFRNRKGDDSIDDVAARIGTAVKEEPADDLREFRQGSVVKFKDVKRFEDFKIHLDGQILDSEIPVEAKMKYYELCRSQKMFLHDGLMAGLGSKLVAGMISKTSDIASVLTCARLGPCLSTLVHDLEHCDKALKAFEELGMSVGFLRGRIDKLVKISRAYQTVEGSLRAKSAEVEETDRALKEKVSAMDALLQSVETLKSSKKSAQAEIDAFEEEAEELDEMFHFVAAAPWT